MKLQDYLQIQYIRYKTLHAYRKFDWRTIPIKECGEKLVEVPRKLCYPFYFNELKITAESRLYLRERVLDKIYAANKSLEKLDYRLVIYDGWRSLQLQESLFWYYLKLFTVQRFNLENHFSSAVTNDDIKIKFNELGTSIQDSLKNANRIYVSWPSSDANSPSPHSTGGSVDVWLYRNNNSLNLGVPFDHMQDNAGAFYHLKMNYQKFQGNNKMIVQRRSQMLLAMAKAGFSCYGPEFWHYNSGNQMDAMVKKQTARYSYIEP